MSVIAVERVSKVFRSNWRLAPKPVLRDVTFAVEPGECFGFVGPNGAGKTTTIKLLLDLVRPTTGGVRLFGASPGDLAARRRVGFLPERPYFYEHLTAKEALSFYAALAGVEAGERARRSDEMLALVDLSGTGKLPLKRFSKGMLQRIGLAQALIGDPELLILDEPMSGLDPLGRRQVRDIILAERQRGKTVFFSSHILPDVESICDRVAMIHQGRIHLVGEVKALLARAGRDESEVTVRVAEGAALPPAFAHFSPAASGHRHGVVANRELQQVLTSALGAGVEVIAVAPRRGSLEDEFLRGIGEAMAGGA